MNWRAVKAIVQRDLLAVFRSKGVMLPLIIVPLIFMIILPGAFGLLTPVINQLPGANMPDITLFLDRLPPALLAQFEGYTTDQLMIVFMLVYLLAPMFLIIPLMVASVVAADSFAGEKERKTLEALIYTPTTDLELFIGKVLSAMIPALVVTLIGFLLYALTANIAAWPTMGRIFFPNAAWIILVLWVAPATAATGLGATVIVSSKVNSFQEANQIAGIIVLPILALVVGQISGVMYFGVLLTLLLGVLFWVVGGVLLFFGVRTFRRSEILAKG
jgi:ABC-2 type transport system permease protein